MKPIRCSVCKLAPGKQTCLAPIGRYCNTALGKASDGDIIDFEEGWRKTRVVLTRKCHVEVNSAVFTFLLRSIYGDNFTWSLLKADWEALCVNEGLGAKAFSEKEALLVEFRTFDKHEYMAEQEARRKRQEVLEKTIAREKALVNARMGIYSHPDILN